MNPKLGCREVFGHFGGRTLEANDNSLNIYYQKINWKVSWIASEHQDVEPTLLSERVEEHYDVLIKINVLNL